MYQMNENSSQTIKELSEDNEIKNLSELDNDSVPQNEEDSFEKVDIPSADLSIIFPEYPSEIIISQLPDVILFGSINPTKYSFKKLERIKSEAS